MLRTLVVSALFAVACAAQMPAQPAFQKGAESGGDPVTDSQYDPDTANPPAKPSHSLIPINPSSDATPTTPAPPGAIRRAELAKVLDQSPGYFLQQVQTEPRFAHGKFHGWRLITFFPGDARFAGVDLQAGDVVTRINGKAIEKPEEFMAVWTDLRTSKELVVDVERGGAPRRLRWTIADK